MHWPRALVLVIALAAATEVLAQLPTYGVGRTPSTKEIHDQDITVGPSGKELPQGGGTAKEGAAIFEKRCAHCHGVNGESEIGRAHV